MSVAKTGTPRKKPVTHRDAVEPAIKYLGGKRWQIPMLKLLWAPHSHRRLVEPFCGGLSVALGLRPSRALLNDINVPLITLYLLMKEGLQVELPRQYEQVRAEMSRRLHPTRGAAVESSGQCR